MTRKKSQSDENSNEEASVAPKRKPERKGNMAEPMEGKWRDAGLLVVRLGLGAILVVVHGWPMISGGTEAWKAEGAHMANVGITSGVLMWGVAMVFSQFVGGFAMMAGILFRPFCLLVALAMVVYAAASFGADAAESQPALLDSVRAAETFILMGLSSLALAMIGPGKFNLGHYLKVGKGE